MNEKKSYTYLFSLKNEREQEEKISKILKAQGNVKEYLIRAVEYYEERFIRDEAIKKELENIQSEIQKIRMNTGF